MIRVYTQLNFFCLLLMFGNSDQISVLNQSSGFIQSSDLSKEEKSKSPVKWQVIAPTSKVIEIAFKEFHVGLKTCGNCEECNRIKIWDKSTLIGGVSYCAGNKPPNFRSSSNNFTIELYNEIKQQPSNFTLQWNQKDKCNKDTEFECWNGNCVKETLHCNKINDCGDDSDEIECAHRNEKCGKNIITPSFTWYQRIIGGQPAREGSWPWMAMLVKGTSQFCGASVISDSWLLTAAHCVTDDWRRIDAYVGRYNLKGNPNTEQKLTVKRFIVHADYNSETLENDIALMQVNEEIKFTDYIQPICILPPSQTTNLENEPHHVCIAIGWGTLEHDTNRRPDELHQVRLPLVNKKACIKSYQRYYSKIRNFHICSGATGKDTCQGDSGGPLMCFIDEKKWTLTGVSSFGFGCGTHLPGIYTNITYYYRWIKTATSSAARTVPISYIHMSMLIYMVIHCSLL